MKFLRYEDIQVKIPTHIPLSIAPQIIQLLRGLEFVRGRDSAWSTNFLNKHHKYELKLERLALDKDVMPKLWIKLEEQNKTKFFYDYIVDKIDAWIGMDKKPPYQQIKQYDQNILLLEKLNKNLGLFNSVSDFTCDLFEQILTHELKKQWLRENIQGQTSTIPPMNEMFLYMLYSLAESLKSNRGIFLENVKKQKSAFVTKRNDPNGFRTFLICRIYECLYSIFNKNNYSLICDIANIIFLDEGELTEDHIKGIVAPYR